MQKNFKHQFPDKDFIMDVTSNNRLKQIDEPYSFRNYLSKEYTITGKKAYQFWAFDEYRGIDRFLYIPDKGIVGGSYDFYFGLKSKISSNEYFSICTLE